MEQGVFYSDNPGGDTLWFKANVPLKMIQISKLFQVKTEKRFMLESSKFMRNPSQNNLETEEQNWRTHLPEFMITTKTEGYWQKGRRIDQ